MAIELSIEQEFELEKLRRDAEKASPKQLTDLLINATRLLMLKNNFLIEVLKKAPL